MVRCQRAPVFFVRIRCRLALRCGDRIFDLLHCLSPPTLDRPEFYSLLAQQILLSHFEAIPPKRRLLQLGIHIAGVVMLAMSTETKQPCYDQLGARASSSFGDGFARDF